MNSLRKRLIVGVTAVAAVGLAGGAVAYATGSDSEGRLTGPRAGRAIHAALDATGGGTANGVELDGENGATWEVEVARSDGSVVDVRLDDNFKVVVIEGDGESAATDDTDD